MLINGNNKKKNKLEVWKLGANKTESDYLFNLVKQGIKTATSYLYDETFVEPSKYSILTNWDETEEIGLETISFCIVPFNDVTKEYALKEGEGAITLNEWKLVHKEFFTKRLALQGKEFSEDIKIVCEEFRIVKVLE